MRTILSTDEILLKRFYPDATAIAAGTVDP